MGKFIIKKTANNEYKFNLIAENGQIILSSERYTTKAACNNGIQSVQRNSQFDSSYDRRTSSNGKYYFTLKAQNGEIIGTSELYESVSGRENAINSVKINSRTKTIENKYA